MPKKSAEPCAARLVTLSPVAHPSPLSIMKWTGGFGASAEASNSTVRAHETWRPSRTSDAAWRTFSGVRKVERSELVVRAPAAPVAERVEVAEHLGFGRYRRAGHGVSMRSVSARRPAARPPGRSSVLPGVPSSVRLAAYCIVTLAPRCAGLRLTYVEAAIGTSRVARRQQCAGDRRRLRGRGAARRASGRLSATTPTARC